MVKCPGKKDNGESCGSELEEGTKFCGECGLKIDQSIFKKRTIQCHGTLEEGGPCDEIIQEGKRFCQNCGWKVDQTLFQIKEKRCGNTKCGAVLPDNSKFCEECGTKVKPPISDASKQISLTQRQEESKRKRPEIPTQDTESKHEQETDQTTSDVPDKNNSGRSEFESTLYKSSDVEILNDGEDGVEKDVTDVIKDVSVPEEDIGIKEEQNQSIQKETQEDGKENPFHKSNTDGNQIQNQANEGQSQHEELDKHVGKGRNNLEQEDNPVMEKRNKGDERSTEENGGINQEDKEQNQMELVDNQDEIEQNLSNQDKNPVTEEHYQTDEDITEEDGVQNQGENGKSQKNEVDKTPVNEEHNSKEEGNTEEDGGQNQGEDRQSQKNEVDEILTEEQSLMDVEDNPLQDDQDRGDDGQSEDVEGQNQTYKIDDHFEKEKNHTATTKTPTTGEQKEQTEKYEVDQKPIQVDEEVDQKPTQVDEEKKHMGEDESHRSSRGGEGKKQIEPIHEEGQAEHQVNQEDGQVDARKSHRNEEQNKDEGQNQFNQSQNQGDQKYHGDRIVNEEVDGQNKKDSVKNEQQVSHEQRHNEVDNKQRHMAPGQSKGMNGQNQMNKKPTFEGALNGRKDAGAISDSKKQSESASSISRSNSMRRQDAAAQNISRRGSMKVKGKDTIDVIFHAIESTEGEDVQKAIALQFKAVHGNPSNQPHLKTYYQMKFIKDIPDADNKGLNLGRVFELKVQLRKEDLRNGMEYNYYSKTHKNEWKAEEGLTNKKVIRTLQIPSETLKHYDQWHVYDGYIYKGKLGKEKKSYISKLIQAFFSNSNESKNVQRLKTDGCTALDTLIFPLLDPCMKTAAFKEAMDKISMINYGSLRLSFPSSYGIDYDENEYKSWLYKFVIERRISSMESLGSKRVQENKIISVLLIIHMAVELNLCSYLEDRQNTLFVKLQLEPNIEEKSCEIFNTIQDICQTSVGKTKRSLKYFILYFANCKTNHGYLPHDPSWLNALPLLHLLENRCSPFQRLQLFGSNPEHPNWWGSEEFEEVYRSIKVSSGYNHWRRDPLNTLNGISRYCTLDPILPRTFMAILTTLQIGAVIERGIIPIEVSCACLSYHIRSISKHHYHGEIRSITFALIAVSHQLCECTRRFLRTGKTDHVLAEEIAFAAEIVINIKKMLHQSDWQILVKITETEATNCMLHAYIASGTVFNNVVLFEDDEGSLMKWWKAKTEIGIWTPFENEVLDLAFFLREKGNINLWNKRFSSMEHLPSEKHATHYNETLKRIFKEWLQEIHYRSVLEYYSGKTGDENNAAEFRACLSDVFFERIPEILQCESGWFCNKGISSELTKYFNKNWDNTIPSTDLERFISMLMNWPDFTKIACNLVSIESPEEKKRFLSDDCIRSVETGIDVLENISSALRTKTLSLKVLKVLLQKEKTFINMVTSILDTKHGSGTDNQTKNMLNVTRNEYNEYENVLKVANGIVQLAKRTNEVNIHGIVDSLKEVHDADNMSISDLMQWKKNMYKDVLEIDDTPSNLEGLFKIFDNIDLYVSSFIFDTMWKMFASNALKNAAEEKSYNIIDDILKPAVAECQQFVDRAKENRLTVSDVTLIPLWMKADITDELVLLNNKRTDKWIDQSVHGISRYHSVVSSRKLAGALLDVCSQYSLTGNFDSLKDISREVCNKKCLLADLNDLDIGMEDITETEVNAIEVFAKSRDLVEWLKTELQHGTKDLKRFVDLALTSAGDDPLNVNKVTCLQSAVLGYSSLIFGISKETDEKVLMQICREFFVNLHSNNRLPSQLEATRSQLSWFQSVRNLLGSVELMSVEQAELINKRGFYRVGNIGKIDVSSGGKLDLNEVVELRLTEAEKTPHHDLDEKPLMKEQRSKTKYSFSELLDLQSRLMLVAGIQNIDTDEEEQERSTESARANTNRFTLIFDNITRLAEEYTRLWTAGCMLFKLWHVDVYCNPNSRIGVKVNFQIGGKAHSLDGKNEDGNVGDLLATLSTFMENCLERWNSHVNKQRENFYYLNYFTIDQLVILQRELSNVGKTCETSPMLYPMLQCVNHTCTPQQIEQIVAETKTEMHEKDLEKRFRQENTGDRTDEDLDLFVQRLVKAGFSKQFALAAITKGKILPKDIREGILWCMKNKKNEAYWTASEGEEQSTAMKADLWFDDLEQRRKEARLRTLSNDMSEIWDKYLTASSSSASDFFSLEHVAHVLQRLGENDHMNTRREFSLPFKSGIPNLLVCERDEMYTRTLSMYMFEDDADTPNGTYGDRNLPLHDEVLLCTKNTTFEEIFQMRAKVFLEHEASDILLTLGGI